MKKRHGFTLIEAMVTVGIVAILAPVAAPAYLSQQRKGVRGEVVNALGRLAVEMNRCYSDQGGYTCCNDAAILPKVLNAPPLTDQGNYTIAITPNANDGGLIGCKVAQGFIITATAVGDQAKDKCYTFTIDSSGSRIAKDVGAVNQPTCWTDQ